MSRKRSALGSNNIAIEREITPDGYDTVKKVADNLDAITSLADVIDTDIDLDALTGVLDHLGDSINDLAVLASADLLAISTDLNKGNYLGNRKIDIDLALNNNSGTSEVYYKGATIVTNTGAVVSIDFTTQDESGNTVINELTSYTGIFNAIQKGIEDYNENTQNDQDKIVNTETDIVNSTISTEPTVIRFRDADGSSSNIDRVELHTYSGDFNDSDPAYFWAKTTSALQTLANRVGDVIALGNDIDSIIELASQIDEIGYLYSNRDKLTGDTLSLFSELDKLQVVHTSISSVVALADNIVSLANVNNSIDSVISVSDNMQSVLDAEGNANIAKSKATEASYSAISAEQSAQEAISRLSAVERIHVESTYTGQAGDDAEVTLDSLTGALSFIIPKGDKGDTGEAFEIKAIGTESQRSIYSGQPEGFSFLATDTSLIYFKLSGTDDDWSQGSSFGKGDKGDQGISGSGGSRNTVLNQEPVSLTTAIETGYSVVQMVGTGSGQFIETGIDLSGDAGYIIQGKNLDTISDHYLINSIRGLNRTVSLNTSLSEELVGGHISNLTTTGFTAEGDIEVNPTGDRFVIETFKLTHKTEGVTNHGKPYTCHYNPYLGKSICVVAASGQGGHAVPNHLGSMGDKVVFKTLNSTSMSIPVKSKHFADENDFIDLSSDTIMDSSDFAVLTPDGVQLNAGGTWNDLEDNPIMIITDIAIEGFSDFGIHLGTDAVGAETRTGFDVGTFQTKSTTGVHSWEKYHSTGGVDGEMYFSDATSGLNDATTSDPRVSFDSTGVQYLDASATRNGINNQYFYEAYARSSYKDSTRATFDFENPDSNQQVSISENTLISFANGFNATSPVDLFEVVPENTVFTLPTGYVDKELHLYKDYDGSYGVTDLPYAEGLSREAADTWGRDNGDGTRSPETHSDYVSNTGVISATSKWSDTLSVYNTLRGGSNSNERWVTHSTSYDATTGTATDARGYEAVTYEFSESRVQESFRLQSRLDIHSPNPRDFSLFGSNGDGTFEEILKVVGAEELAQGAWSPLYSIPSSESFKTIQLRIYTVNPINQSYCAIKQLKFNTTALIGDFYNIQSGEMEFADFIPDTWGQDNEDGTRSLDVHAGYVSSTSTISASSEITVFPVYSALDNDDDTSYISASGTFDPTTGLVVNSRGYEYIDVVLTEQRCISSLRYKTRNSNRRTTNREWSIWGSLNGTDYIQLLDILDETELGVSEWSTSKVITDTRKFISVQIRVNSVHPSTDIDWMAISELDIRTTSTDAVGDTWGVDNGDGTRSPDVHTTYISDTSTISSGGEDYSTISSFAAYNALDNDDATDYRSPNGTIAALTGFAKDPRGYEYIDVLFTEPRTLASLRYKTGSTVDRTTNREWSIWGSVNGTDYVQLLYILDSGALGASEWCDTKVITDTREFISVQIRVNSVSAGGFTFWWVISELDIRTHTKPTPEKPTARVYLAKLKTGSDGGVVSVENYPVAREAVNDLTVNGLFNPKGNRWIERIGRVYSKNRYSFENPYGNENWLNCTATAFVLVDGKWAETGNGNDLGTGGSGYFTLAYSLSEGIVVQTGNTAVVHPGGRYSGSGHSDTGSRLLEAQCFVVVEYRGELTNA